MDLDDQLQQLPVLEVAGRAFVFRTDPGEVAGVVGGDDPGDPPDREPFAQGWMNANRSRADA